MTTPPERAALKRLRTEFADSALERRFRRSTAADDARYGIQLLLVVSAAYILLIVYELATLGLDQAIGEVALICLVVASSGGLLAWFVRQHRTSVSVEIAALLYILMLCAVDDSLNLVIARVNRDMHWLETSAVGSILAVMAVYVAVPARIAVQVIGALCLTVAFFMLIYVWPNVSAANIGVLAMLFLATHAIGFVLARRAHESRRLLWLNLDKERQLTEQLQEEMTRRELLEGQLRDQAITDPLTGIYNRRHLFQEGTEFFSQARRYKRPFAIILFDVDHFKRINDTHGHQVGDEVLKSIVGVVGGTLREPDVFCRYGGEEFAIILPETNPVGANKLAERIRKSVESLIIKIGNVRENVTVSLGVATINDEDREFDALLLRADDALFTAKEKGRNTFVCAV